MMRRRKKIQIEIRYISTTSFRNYIYIYIYYILYILFCLYILLSFDIYIYATHKEELYLRRVLHLPIPISALFEQSFLGLSR